MTDYVDLTYEVRGRVALISLNRPEKLNALNPAMSESLAEALTDAQRDDNIRVVVLTGTGRGFCSGQDLSGRSLAEGRGLPDGQEATIADRRYNIRAVQSVARAAQALDKPYLAAVNGPAAGAGMDLASMTDIRFAARDAKFTTAFARNGIVSGDGGCYYLPRIVGMAKALELLWTSRLFDADEALSLGYVSRVVETTSLLDETLAFADELANAAADRRAVHQAARLPVAERRPRYGATHGPVHADHRHLDRRCTRRAAGVPREAPAGVPGPLDALGQRQSWLEAMRAPSTRASNFAQTTDGWTRCTAWLWAKPQSVPGDDVLPPDEAREAHDALGHELGVLDDRRVVRDRRRG